MWILLLMIQQGQSVYDEAEEQRLKSFIFGFHPQPVCVSSQRHTDGTQQLLCQRKSLVVLQKRGDTLDGEMPPTLLYPAHLLR